ncbi:MAG: HDOD domain-containing protein [Nitrospirae bacterium]|nr:HDOD domain-containing protein [Nitrospirota bacterium]
MAKSIGEYEAAEIINSIDVPIQANIINNLYKEIKKPNPDFRIITEETSKDAGLSAAVLKTANSPFFTSGGISSIDRAISVIGLNNYFNVVVSSIYQEAFKAFPNKDILKQFWYHSMLVATIMSSIANKNRNINASDAYLTGLFHDCAIPSFMMKFPDYAEIYILALGYDSSIIDTENTKYKTNHCIAGSLLTKSWQLPDAIVNVINHHHDNDIRVHKNPVERKLAAAHRLAECVSYNYKNTSKCLPGSLKKGRKEIMSDKSSVKSVFGDAIDFEVVFQELNFDKNDLEDLGRDVAGTTGKY